MEGEDIYLSLSIPNGEIRSVYRQSILQWFDRKIRQTDRRPFIKALEEGDCKTAEEFICRQPLDTISYFDYAEKILSWFPWPGSLQALKTMRCCQTERAAQEGRI